MIWAERDYESMIVKHNKWGKVTESTWNNILTEQSAAEIRNYLTGTWITTTAFCYQKWLWQLGVILWQT
jgi:hypothetical protein